MAADRLTPATAPGRYPRVRTNETGAEVVDVVCPKGHPGGKGEVTTGYLGLATCDKCGEKLVAVEEADAAGNTTYRNGKPVSVKDANARRDDTGAAKLARASGGNKTPGKRAKPKAAKPKAEAGAYTEPTRAKATRKASKGTKKTKGAKAS